MVKAGKVNDKISYLNSHIKKLDIEEQIKTQSVWKGKKQIVCDTQSNRKQINNCVGWKLKVIDHKGSAENILAWEFSHFDGSGDYKKI